MQKGRFRRDHRKRYPLSNESFKRYKISPWGTAVTNINVGSLYDCRLLGPSLRFGPFKSIGRSSHMAISAA